MGCKQSSPKAAEPEGKSKGPSTPFDAVITHKPFASLYKLGKVLGKGTFSEVKEATYLPDGTKWAVKCINKRELSDEDLEALVVEVTVLAQLSHPNIVQFKSFFSEKTHYYLVTELMTGGELFERIVEKEFYSEEEARSVVRTMCEAIGFCHERSIVHRDLKPENVLLNSTDADAIIKIADFGFAKKVDGRGLNTACGTPGYVAPEILSGVPYGLAVDMWSIGVISYILLCGYPPFHHDDQAKLFKLIKRGEFRFDSPDWDNVSKEAKDLISKLLVVDPRKRLTCAQVLSHPWITGSVPKVQLVSAKTKLKEFNARRKWRNGINAVRAGVRMKMMMAGAKAGAAATAESPSNAGSGAGAGAAEVKE